MLTEKKFEKNEVRQFPTKDSILKDKKLNDIIYGFYQIHSYLTPDKQRYCFKSETTAAKVIEYFQNSPEGRACPVSERTIRSMIKLFIGCGILQEGTIDKKKAYILPELAAGEFEYIKTETLRYLVNTATSNVIKVYAFLMKKQKQHIKGNFTEPYKFSKTKILEILGYTGSNSSSFKMVDDILDCLINNQLIAVHKEVTITRNNIKTEYFVLDDVYDDYKHNINVTPKANEETVYCAVPVPADIDKPFVF